MLKASYARCQYRHGREQHGRNPRKRPRSIRINAGRTHPRRLHIGASDIRPHLCLTHRSPFNVEVWSPLGPYVPPPISYANGATLKGRIGEWLAVVMRCVQLPEYGRVLGAQHVENSETPAQHILGGRPGIDRLCLTPPCHREPPNVPGSLRGQQRTGNPCQGPYPHPVGRGPGRLRGTTFQRRAVPSVRDSGKGHPGYRARLRRDPLRLALVLRSDRARCTRAPG